MSKKQDGPETNTIEIEDVLESIEDLRAGRETVGRMDALHSSHVLSEITTSFTRVRDIHDLADAIESAIDRTVSVEFMALYLRNPRNNELQVLRVKGITEAERQRLEQNAINSFPGDVLAMELPLYISDVFAETMPRREAMSRTLQIRSRLFLPIRSNDTGVGVLAFESTVPHAFSRQRRSILFTLCNLAGCIYHHLAALESLSREQSELLQRVDERTASLERVNVELETASKMKDEFLANMSHELRTPMNAVIGLTEAVLEGTYGGLSEAQYKSLNTILNSGRHLLSLINDILDLAKIQAGTLEPNRLPVSVLSTCRASMQLVREQASKKKQNLSLGDIPNDMYMMVDERHIKQVLVNLLSNAVKFTPEAGNIGVSVKEDESWIRISVWDEGVGIPEEHMDQLFQPFWQADAGLARWHEGTGLGLKLVKQFTELNGGTVAAESTLGSGSRFTINVPLSEEKPYPRRNSRPDLRNVSKVVRARKILLAEDNAQNIDLLGNYLRARGYRVDVATDGVQALEMIQKGEYELVLMDIQMPLMDGLEVTRRVKIDPSFSHIPVVGLTALAMEGDRQKCLDAGCDAYLSKPVSLRALVETIEMLTESDASAKSLGEKPWTSMVTTPTSTKTEPDNQS